MNEEVKSTLKNNWLWLSLIVVAFIGVLVFAFNSPLYQETKERERENAIQNLVLNYSISTSAEIEKIKQAYNIQDSEIEQYMSTAILEGLIKGEVSNQYEIETPIFDVMTLVEPFLGGILAAGVLIYIYREFNLKPVILRKIREIKNEEVN